MTTKIFTTIATLMLATSAIAQNTNLNDSISKSLMLDEVKVSMPAKTKMKGNGMLTRVVGTSIATAGTALDVLSRIPGMMTLNGELQVIGRGTPIYYINGRKVQDNTELQHLSSHDIKNVEIISNPGALYDAQANAVVRIQTIRRKGEGIGITFDSSEENAPSCGNNRFSSTLNLNYRHNNMDIFGGASYDNNHLNNYRTEAGQESFGKDYFCQQGSTNLKQQYNYMRYNFGLNWQFGENHSLGFKLEKTDNLKGRHNFTMDEDALKNNILEDHLYTYTHNDVDGTNSLLGNAYYNGNIGKTTLDWNIDFYHTNYRNDAYTTEESYSGTKLINASNEARNNLFATKLVASLQRNNGTLQYGLEFILAHRKNKYDISLNYINADRSNISENTYAFFLDYGKFIPRLGMLNVGVRYEHVDFSYENKNDLSQNLGRHHDNIFPFASLGTRIGNIEASLSYSVRTNRPSYQTLRSNIEYNNRFTLSTGDPKLKNEIRHEAGLNARYKWLAMAVNYGYHIDGIYDWTYPYSDDGKVLISWVNISKPLQRLSAYINASPTIGIWQPSYTIGIQKQWLSFELTDPRTTSGTRNVTYNKPMLVFNTNNAFSIPTSGNKGKWLFELNSELLSNSNFGNATLHNWFWNLSCSVQKSFLKNDALSVRLYMGDIFHTAYHNISIDLGNYIMRQTRILGQSRDLYDLQRLTLSLRYKFNVTKSKYKGTGAGQGVRSRM